MNFKEFLNLKTGDKIDVPNFGIMNVNVDNQEPYYIHINNSISGYTIRKNYNIGTGYEFRFWIDGDLVVKTVDQINEFISSWKLIGSTPELSNQEILNLSISTFPVDSHYRQLNEEIGEFNVALSHYFRNRCGIESVIEEIADVKQMLDTWMLILKISKEDYEKVENEKYQKLLSQINEFKKKSETDFRKLIEEQKLKGEI